METFPLNLLQSFQIVSYTFCTGNRNDRKYRVSFEVETEGGWKAKCCDQGAPGICDAWHISQERITRLKLSSNVIWYGHISSDSDATLFSEKTLELKGKCGTKFLRKSSPFFLSSYLVDVELHCCLYIHNGLLVNFFVVFVYLPCNVFHFLESVIKFLR